MSGNPGFVELAVERGPADLEAAIGPALGQSARQHNCLGHGRARVEHVIAGVFHEARDIEPLRDRHVALYGAGGAGSAIACELAKAGVATVAIIDPQAARAESLAKVLREAFPACETVTATALPATADMIVNASTVGMRAGDGLPGATGPLAPSVFVGDVVVSETPTPIIQHAIRHGCRFVTGRDMHAGQVDALLGFFETPH